MKARTVRTVKIVLELEEKEAKWLKSVVQNPIGNCTPAEEDDTDKDMRLKFWTFLNDVSM